MIEASRLALNRIVCPSLEIEAFLELAASAGFASVELRNDLPGRGVGDARSAAELRRILDRLGLKVLTINALQKFNLPEGLDRLRQELRGLLAAAGELDIPAIVLCPNNDPSDQRGAQRRRADLVECLGVFRPLFEDFGRKGYLEPLGFGESSLSSLAVAAAAVREAGGDCYRLVWDTFHHYLGPEDASVLGGPVEPDRIGLVHVSGVEASEPADGYRDEHRVLPSAADRMRSREQIARLLAAGYTGAVSLEPFSPAVQHLEPHALRSALRSSIEYLTGAP